MVAFRATCTKNFRSNENNEENPGKKTRLSKHWTLVCRIYFLFKMIRNIFCQTIIEFLVIWKNIDYSIGSAFDQSTGVFTCPYDGIYSFYATAPIDSHTYGDVSIYVNGSEKIRYHQSNEGDSKNHLKHSSPNGALKLKKGDNVHIRMTGTFNHMSCQKRTYFQGYLINLL